MILSMDGKSPGLQVYRPRWQPAQPQQPTTVQDLLTPVHPNRWGLVLRAVASEPHGPIIYFQAARSDQSNPRAWGMYRPSTPQEQRLILPLLADDSVVQEEVFFGILLFSKSEKGSQ